ncbi:MAG: hypothetical protein WDO73_23810 [Ignavibacteriota bacterium]
MKIAIQQGEPVYVDIVGNRYLVGTQPVVQLNIRDISARKQSRQSTGGNRGAVPGGSGEHSRLRHLSNQR